MYAYIELSYFNNHISTRNTKAYRKHFSFSHHNVLLGWQIFLYDSHLFDFVKCSHWSIATSVWQRYSHWSVSLATSVYQRFTLVNSSFSLSKAPYLTSIIDVVMCATKVVGRTWFVHISNFIICTISLFHILIQCFYDYGIHLDNGHT
jgi:hypothetical protein